MKLYLSPSAQSGNSYYGTTATTEKIQMEAVAAKVKALLDKGYECTTVIATPSLSIERAHRPQEAKDRDCNFYLAIHSNAAGAKPQYTAWGAVGFYHPSYPISRKLMDAMVRELDAIAPKISGKASNRSQKIYDGVSWGFKEIRFPAEKNIASALIEVNFHDHPQVAEWIVNNKDAIAGAIVKAVAETFALKSIGGNPPDWVPAEGDIVRFKDGVTTYYPGGPGIAASAKTGDPHMVSKVDSGGRQVVYGGSKCVLLGKRVNLDTRKESVGVNTWTAVEFLALAEEAGTARAAQEEVA